MRCVGSSQPDEAVDFNPVSDVPFTAQINLAPPLISRFDIIWLLTDTPDGARDEQIASHIIDNRLKGSSELLVKDGTIPDPSRSTVQRATSKRADGTYEVLPRENFEKIRCVFQAELSSQTGRRGAGNDR